MEQQAQDAPVTLAPPVGDRDPAYPLRGREALLAELLQVCRSGGGGLLHVLHGLGGCGKTALALELVHRLRSGRTGVPRRMVWWVDARHAVVLGTGLRAVARQAGVGREEASAGWAVDVLWERLADMRDDWLLVIDNVDDPHVLDGPGRLVSGTGWLRPHAAPSGVVLITTRDGNARTWGPSAKLHALTPLSDAAASQILIDHAGPEAGTLEAAQALATRLGRLPLALRMAGSYLAEVNGMPRAFRDPDTPINFSDYQAALDGPAGTGLHPARAIEKTWRMSVEYLHGHGFRHAGPLLDILATFADAPIPYTLLLRPDALADSHPEFADLDGPALWATLSELSALGLIDLHNPQDAPPTVSLHPLIRDASRSRTQVSQAAHLLNWVLQLEELRQPEEPGAWSAWHALFPHALTLLDHARQPELELPCRGHLAEAAEAAGRYLRARGQVHEAAHQFERILAVRLEFWGPQHAGTLSTQQHLARALHDLGQMEQARHLYEMVWRTNRDLQGDEHLHTLIARHELGRLLHDSGDLRSAHAHLSAVLQAHRDARGDEHRYTLTARHELARVLHDEGDFHAARDEYELVLSARHRLLGEHHPRTLTARHNRACVLADLGMLAEAHHELLAVTAARQRVLGEEHHATLSTQYRLARVLHARGKAAQAEALLRGVEASASRTLGAAHPQTRKAKEALQALGRSSDPL
ncbi:tetratricopeptide repeat protein [Streptomyces sp. NPDC091972]|uniref:tetratricopeptide repeat protein n=1 Tax=Streptomyces sp. NPDC091972 TaxID=3366007 RepID=UPI00381566FF